MSVLSIGGARYMVIFKDDFSGYSSVSFLKQKSEASEHFKYFVLRLEKETKQQVNIFRTDNGGEYTGGEFQSCLRSKAIRHETSIPKTPQQNGVSERQNRTIIESARSMMTATNQPLHLWAEASNCAVYLRNRVLGKALVNMTPYEAWHGRKPNVSHIRMFGCEAFMHIPHDERSKFSPKVRKCKFVGYCETQKGFRLWDPESRRIRVSRDVIFHEDVPTDFYTEQLITSQIPINEEFSPEPDVTEAAHHSPDSNEVCDPEIFNDKKSSDLTELLTEEIPEIEPRKRRPPVRWADESLTGIYAKLAGVDDLTEPATYEEALSSAQSANWIAAMKDEMDSLLKNETWFLTHLPVERASIKNRWVFKLKRRGPEGVKFKAGMVAKGFLQNPGVDYGETYSPVVKHDSLRVILSIVAAHDLEIVQLDVKTAFLYGDIDEELYMDQPSGFQDGSGQVCRLKKSLYWTKAIKKRMEHQIQLFSY